MTDRYKKRGDAILDTATGLEWQAEATEGVTWYEANEYAKSLGDGWRLPTIEELSTLIDYSRVSPATTFPDHGKAAFWSSSVVADHTNYARLVLFGVGFVCGYNKFGDHHVRCVRRDGPLGTGTLNAKPLLCTRAYVVVMDDDIFVAFGTIEEAKKYAEQFVFYRIVPYEMLIGSIDERCVIDPDGVLNKQED